MKPQIKLNEKALRLALKEYYGSVSGIPKYEHDSFIRALKIYLITESEVSEDLRHEQAGPGI